MQLESDIQRLSQHTTEKLQMKKHLETEQQQLLEEKRQIERQLAELIANNLAKGVLLENSTEVTTEDLVKKEIFTALNQATSEEISRLKVVFIEKEKKADQLQKEILTLNNTLNELEEKQQRVASLKQEEQRTLADLAQEKKHYDQKLAEFLQQEEREKKLLAALNIYHKKALEQRQAELQRQKEQQARMAETQHFKDAEKIRVKQYGSSYVATKSRHYRGRKVKAPLDDTISFNVTKKFGPYVDPVYKIRIHNDSVTLAPSRNNAIVRNIMNGKVVYADELKMLGKVVIIKHDNGMHSIYRNLEEIAPGIQKDRWVKSRTAIGRVQDELVFEVTKDGSPINPLEVIHSRG